MSRDPLVILSARRTPVGAFQGVFAAMTAPQLGSVAIKAALADSRVAAADVDEVIMGCVLSAGLGQAPARQAALGAGIPASVPSTTVNKMCGSAMRAIMLAGDQILAGSARIIVAGGLESMTNAPYLLPKARAGYRMGHQEVLDHMFTDGLQSPWDGQLMGCFAEATSGKYDFSRQAQDDFARESTRRAQAAIASGAFAGEIAPVTAKTRKGESVIDKDETPGTIDVSKIPTLKPAFRKDGSVTAASSASISDGAAAVVLTRESVARERGFKPIARILGYTSFAREPEWFTLAPVGAMQKLLQANRMARGRCGSVRDQRSVRGGSDGGHEGSGTGSWQGQRERGGLLAGSSDRRDRCTHRDHASPCAEEPRQEARHCESLHRWRRGDGDRDRAGLRGKASAKWGWASLPNHAQSIGHP